MDEYLRNLIERMCDQSDQVLEVGYDSSKTISWKATREAEKVENTEYIPQIMKFIDKEKNKKRRKEAYFLLGHIGKNTNSIEPIVYLIKRLNMESDKYIISSILDRIARLKKPPDIDLNPLINLTKSEKWQIRHSAIQSLKYSQNPKAEKSLIDILENSTNKYDICYCNSTLSDIGTMKAIPYLQRHLSSRVRDIKATANYAIEEIIKREA